MADPFVGEIRMFGGNYAPNGWLFCEGQTLAISQFEVLFLLIGTTYGGDGEQTFCVPDLRGRVPIHQGNGAGGSYVTGQQGGQESVVLTAQQLPSHTHLVVAADQPAETAKVNGARLAEADDLTYALPGGSPAPMSPNAVDVAGSSLPHENMQPFLCVNFIISLFGIFPSQS